MTPWMISLIGGIASGVVSLIITVVILNRKMQRANRDLDLYYENMNSLKQDPLSDEVGDVTGLMIALRLLLFSGILPSCVMILAFGIAQNLIEGTGGIIIILLTWLAVTLFPLFIMNERKNKRTAILEIASILENIAHSKSDYGPQWAIYGVKKVMGGDLFGEEEEDRFDFQLSRTEIAPISLKVSGAVMVAEAGIERSVSKSKLREFRLKGWFVDEIRNTEVRISREWSLKTYSYVEIARNLAELIGGLGFSLNSIRFNQLTTPTTETHNSTETPPSTETARSRLSY